MDIDIDELEEKLGSAAHTAVNSFNKMDGLSEESNETVITIAMAVANEILDEQNKVLDDYKTESVSS